jgi:hypothetical protein
MGRYFIIETATNTVTNTIIWDGVSPYDAGEGYELVEVTEESIALYLPPTEGEDND